MSTLVAAKLILWLSIFAVFMPNSVDKQIVNDDTIVIEHRLDNGE